MNCHKNVSSDAMSVCHKLQLELLRRETYKRFALLHAAQLNSVTPAKVDGFRFGWPAFRAPVLHSQWLLFRLLVPWLRLQRVGSGDDDVVALRVPLWLIFRVDNFHLSLVLVSDLLLPHLLSLNRAAQLLEHLEDFRVVLARDHLEISIADVGPEPDSLRLRDAVPDVSLVVVLIHKQDVPAPYFKLMPFFFIIEFAIVSITGCSLFEVARFRAQTRLIPRMDATGRNSRFFGVIGIGLGRRHLVQHDCTLAAVRCSLSLFQRSVGPRRRFHVLAPAAQHLLLSACSGGIIREVVDAHALEVGALVHMVSLRLSALLRARFLFKD